MLPCLNKMLFGVECLGCGFQRAVVFLVKGEFAAAFFMYPAVYSLLILVFFLLFNFFITFKNARLIKMTLIILNVLIIVTSYIIKMSNIFIF